MPRNRRSGSRPFACFWGADEDSLLAHGGAIDKQRAFFYQAISGAIINFNPDAATTTGLFNGGQPLHALEYTRATLTIPVSRP
ncbi:MAG TPA: hypothetical protein VJ810_02610 [Blastocatellia bacterium]|nr:hypothetical protein [Blastocatellia bacterium]